MAILGGVAGGVAAGVGVAVCLPVAGAVGGVTLIGAGIAGTLGATTGGLVSWGKEKLEDIERESAFNQGEKEATAKYQQKVEKLVVALEIADKKINENKSYHQLLLAMFAVGMATANADGVISDEELVDLDEFTAGISHASLPSHVKQAISHIKESPPNLETAIKYVKRVPQIDSILFESIIEVISASDNKVTEEEVAFLEAFRQANT